MPNYRRAYAAGGCWFFTVNLRDRRETLLVYHVDILRDAVAATGERFPFEIDAIVILPDHIHAIFSLPQDDTDFLTRGRLIKALFFEGAASTGMA
jgi:REP-associated tyrosine transposase